MIKNETISNYKKIIDNKNIIDKIYLDYDRKIPNGLFISRVKMKGKLYSGCDKNKNLAIIKSISEALEYYCLSKLKPLFKSSADKIKNIEILSANYLTFFNSNQYKNNSMNKYSDKLNMEWISFKNLENSENMLIPYSLVAFTKYNSIFKANTSGTSVHISEENAISHAIYELIEKDALMIFWWSRCCPNLSKWEINNLDDEFLFYYEFLKHTNDSVEILLWKL